VVVDKKCDVTVWTAGEYAICDMAIFPWVLYVEKNYGIVATFGEFPNISRWLHRIGERPAVQKGLTICARS